MGINKEINDNIEIRKIENVSSYLPCVDEAQADADFYAGVSENGEEIFGILHEDEVIGLSCIVDEADGFLYVYIFPEFRGKGFGTKAAKASEAKMQAENRWKITTTYDHHNEIARKLAETCGFKKKFASAIMKYEGGKFEEKPLPVRKYREEDFVPAFTLEDEAFHKMRLESGSFPDSKRSEPSDDMRNFYAEHAEGEYVYLDGDEIIGFAQIDGAELSSVSVRLTHQGRGIGRDFTKFLVNQILEQENEVPFLYCIVGNHKARRLYESLGFKEISCNEYAEKFCLEHPNGKKL